MSTLGRLAGKEGAVITWYLKDQVVRQCFLHAEDIDFPSTSSRTIRYPVPAFTNIVKTELVDDYTSRSTLTVSYWHLLRRFGLLAQHIWQDVEATGLSLG